MKQSNLDKYISTLMSNDNELAKFIKNPEQSEEEHGITKAERSVLRRVVQHLPATSKSKFGARGKGSYRRSLRLLQNVLHNNATKIPHATKEEAIEGRDYYYLMIYYPAGGPGDYTGKTNAEIASYATASPLYPLLLTSKTDEHGAYVTVEDIMNAAAEYYRIQYTVKDAVVTEISDYIADLTDPRYDLKLHPDANYVFWFYSVNGHPSKTNKEEGPRTAGSGSFTTFKVRPYDRVFWQLIAPDYTYGFQHCLAPDEDEHLNLNAV